MFPVPVCIACGLTTKSKLTYSGANAGRFFYSCPSCNEFIGFMDAPLPNPRSRILATYSLPVAIEDKPDVASGEFTFDVSASDLGHFEDMAPYFSVDISLNKASGDLLVKFGYDSRLVDVWKKNMPSRSWDKAMKAWKCPMMAASRAIALFEHIGMRPKLRPATLLDSVQRMARDPSKRDSILVELHEGCDNNMREPLVYVRFHHDASLLNAVRSVFPRIRQWSSQEKAWICTRSAVPELLEHFLEYVDPWPQRFLDLVAAIKREEAEQHEDIHEEAKKQRVGALDSLPAIPAPSWSSPQPESATSSSSSSSTSHPPRPIAPPHLSEWSSRHKVPSTKSEPPPPPVDCECGYPERVAKGLGHVCRFYGSFACPSCGNRWTSGWTWKGEKQSCKKCNTESLPWKKDKLQKLETSNIAGPHDSKRCGMCKKLGTDCSFLRNRT
eukprot:TRINITY_DN271_c0_g1_i1.p1 TRINITY_DN271_c0_g1~~TRINITY_DN271_c0_g1_i1.p1  ORF type:complete len:461 (+),score=107.32 TRINITY_DN271_c0_g1_i1:63-1385(+)